MKKKKIANLIMVAIIVAVAVAGILGVGHIKGWFEKSDEKTAVLTDFRGIITLQRDGVAYATTDETVLRKGDRIACSPGATVRIVLGENYLSLGQDADAEIINPRSDEFAVKVNVGEVFVNTNDAVLLEFADKQKEISNAVATLSVRKGAQSISVYLNSVGDAKEGQLIEWVGGEESVRDFSLKSLNDFNISALRKANETKSLVFSNEDLDKLENERFEQMHSSTETTSETTAVETRPEKTTKKETASATTAKKEPTATVAQTTEATTQPTTKIKTTRRTTTRRDYSLNRTEEPTSETTKTTTASTTKKPKKTETSTTEPETTKRISANSSKAPAIIPATTSEPVETTKEKLTCTITIRCDTILDNMDNLDPAKAPYVPDNGVILREVTVEFEEGETVFDVLNRVCKEYDIPIEYSWTPMYDSYYIEGINNLYEFDCGSESGWMYKVNGWFPNYGCSSYYLTGGETIVWCYTCNGLGEDVGAERWE